MGKWQCGWLVIGTILLVLGGCSNFSRKMQYDMHLAQEDLGAISSQDLMAAHITGNNYQLREYWLQLKPQFLKISARSHFYMCEALLDMGSFAEAKECIDLLSRQLNEDLNDGFASDATENADKFVLKALYGRYAYLVGDYNAAIQLSNEVIAGAHYDKNQFVGVTRYSEFYWKAHLFAGSSAGLSQLALGADHIDNKYYQAIENDYLWSPRDYQAKMYVAYKAQMFFAEEQYQQALDTLTGDKSAISDNARTGQVVASVLTLGIAPLLNKVMFDDTNVTGEYSFAGNRFVHAYMSARSLYKLGRISEAKQVYDPLLAQLKDSRYTNYYWNALYDRANIALLEQDKSAAAQWLQEAIEVIESQRNTLVTDTTKLSFVDDKQRVYQSYIGLLLTQGNISRAFEYTDRAKARALVDLLASRETSGNGSKRNALYQEWRSLQESPLLLVGNSNEQAQTTRAIQVVYREIKQQQPALSSLISADIPQLNAIQAKLDKDESLIQYFRLEGEYKAFVLSQRGVSYIDLADARVAEIDQQVEQLREKIRDTSSHAYIPFAQALYQRLFAPLQASLLSDKVLIVADGSLNYLPFGALMHGNDFVLDRFDLRYLNAASVLTLINSVDVRNQPVFALGNPDLGDAQLALPGAETEVLALKSLLPDAAVFIRQQATESRLRQLDPTTAILHIASHGQFDSQHPLQSRLLLAKDASDDGILSVNELYELEIPASLVVLSACETGLGDVRNGGDVIGLTRGFIFAGANTVISTLWMVEDESIKALMLHFYTELQQQKQQDLRAALNRAQRQISQTFNRHPYFWSGLTLTGSI